MRHNGTGVKEAPRHTIRRRSDEPKLELGDTIFLKEGVVGVVLASYIPSGGRDEVRYVVEIISDQGDTDTPAQ